MLHVYWTAHQTQYLCQEVLLASGGVVEPLHQQSVELRQNQGGSLHLPGASSLAAVGRRRAAVHAVLIFTGKHQSVDQTLRFSSEQRELDLQLRFHTAPPRPVWVSASVRCMQTAPSPPFVPKLELRNVSVEPNRRHMTETWSRTETEMTCDSDLLLLLQPLCCQRSSPVTSTVLQRKHTAGSEPPEPQAAAALMA